VFLVVRDDSMVTVIAFKAVSRLEVHAPPAGDGGGAAAPAALSPEEIAAAAAGADGAVPKFGLFGLKGVGIMIDRNSQYRTTWADREGGMWTAGLWAELMGTLGGGGDLGNILARAPGAGGKHRRYASSVMLQ
jgi:hypothetical protein